MKHSATLTYQQARWSYWAAVTAFMVAAAVIASGLWNATFATLVAVILAAALAALLRLGLEVVQALLRVEEVLDEIAEQMAVVAVNSQRRPGETPIDHDGGG